MCQKRLRVAFIGCGERTETELFPTLLKDHRIVCVACFSFNDLSLSQMKNNFDFDALKKQSREGMLRLLINYYIS
jgi:predicted dehydrogenase